VSDSPSEKAMLTPAPIAVASPAMNAKCGWRVASATAKIGASVESEPSISPVIAGCTRWSRNERSADSSTGGMRKWSPAGVPLSSAYGGVFRLHLGGHRDPRRLPHTR